MVIYAQPIPRSVLPDPEVMQPLFLTLCLEQSSFTNTQAQPSIQIKRSLSQCGLPAEHAALCRGCGLLNCRPMLVLGLRRHCQNNLCYLVAWSTWIWKKTSRIIFYIKNHGGFFFFFGSPYTFLIKGVKDIFRSLVLLEVSSLVPPPNPLRALRRPLNISQSSGPEK